MTIVDKAKSLKIVILTDLIILRYVTHTCTYNGTQIALNSTVQLHCGQQQSETVTVAQCIDAWPIRKTVKAKYSAFALTDLFNL